MKTKEEKEREEIKKIRYRNKNIYIKKFDLKYYFRKGTNMSMNGESNYKERKRRKEREEKGREIKDKECKIRINRYM